MFELLTTEKEKLIAKERTAIQEQITKRRESLENMRERYNNSGTRNDALRGQIVKTEEELAELERQMRLLVTKKLKDLLPSQNGQVLARIKDEPLTMYLVRNGYLDESYCDYMSYVMGNLGDHAFLRSVTDRKPTGFTYTIENCKEVLDELRPEYFEYQETLNNDLVGCMLANHSEYRRQLEYLMNQLKRERRLDFIAQYLQLGREVESFVKLLNNAWPGIWQAIWEDEEFPSKERHRYAVLSLIYSPSEDVQALNADGSLTEYVSGNSEFLAVGELDESKINAMVANLHTLEVKFKRLDFARSNKDLFKAIYKENLYAINEAMVFLILKEVYNIAETEDYLHHSYTLIVSDRGQPLVEYIYSHMDEYLEFLFRVCEGIIDDSEEAALEVLNHPEVSLEKKQQYLSYLQTTIEKVSSVADKTLWPVILERGLAPCSADNVLDYYFEYSQAFDDALVTLMNQATSPPQLSYGMLLKRYEEEAVRQWVLDLTSCAGLSDLAYDFWIFRIGYIWNRFEIKDLAARKMKIVLKHKRIAMNSDNFQIIRSHYPQFLEDYVYLNIREFLDQVIGGVVFEFRELEGLLERRVSDKYKIRFLEHISGPVSVQNKELSESVMLYTIENNFDEQDLAWLIGRFDNMPKSVQEVIAGLCLERVDLLISQEYAVPTRLLRRFLEGALQDEKKQLLLSVNVRNLSLDEVVACLVAAGWTALIGALKGERPLVPKNDAVRRILEVFRERQWISGFKESEKDPSQYRVIGRTKYHPLRKSHVGA